MTPDPEAFACVLNNQPYEISERQFDAWLNAAVAPQTLCYTIRPGVLRAGWRVGKRIGLLTQSGVLDHIQTRYASGWTAYQVKRRRPPIVAESLPAISADMRELCEDVFLLVARAAEWQKPCPSFADIAETFGVPSHRIRPVIQRLMDEGRISFVSYQMPGRLVRYWHVAGIIATGHTTRQPDFL